MDSTQDGYRTNFYAFIIKLNNKASNIVIICTIYVSYMMDIVFVDPNCAFLYLLIGFIMGLGMVYNYSQVYPCLSIVVDKVCHLSSVVFMGYQTWVHLVILDMVGFYIILGMGWLSLYYAILYYHAKIVIVIISID